MKRVNMIFSDPKYQALLQELKDCEKHRKFCNHTIEHFLDTARIMYIISLENKLNISKGVIYATALLHDIGRVQEYKEGTPHNIASSTIARGFLDKYNFTKVEIDMICSAIESHRNDDNDNTLSQLLYKADKLSRMCHSCSVEQECYWDKDLKNMEILY